MKVTKEKIISKGKYETEVPRLWPPDAKSQLTGKDPDAGEEWRQEEKGATEDEMVGWHHWLDGHELEQTPGDSEGQGSLVCRSPWGRKESDLTEQLNNHKRKVHSKGNKSAIYKASRKVKNIISDVYIHNNY